MKLPALHKGGYKLIQLLAAEPNSIIRKLVLEN